MKGHDKTTSMTILVRVVHQEMKDWKESKKIWRLKNIMLNK